MGNSPRKLLRRELNDKLEGFSSDASQEERACDEKHIADDLQPPTILSEIGPELHYSSGQFAVFSGRARLGPLVRCVVVVWSVWLTWHRLAQSESRHKANNLEDHACQKRKPGCPRHCKSAQWSSKDLAQKNGRREEEKDG